MEPSRSVERGSKSFDAQSSRDLRPLSCRHHRFVDLNDRAKAFRLGAQLAAELSGTNAEQIASQLSEEASASLLLEDLMETYPEVSRETLEVMLQES